MSERFASECERQLAAALQPVHAPDSLWHRVDRDLASQAGVQRRPLPRLALAFGVVLVAVVSVGWYFDRPAPQGSPAAPSMQISRGQHSCVMCHV